jgi:hypothetical protein
VTEFLNEESERVIPSQSSTPHVTNTLSAWARGCTLFMTGQHPLTGPYPGQLDQTQSLRVLRHPDARLSFASFHPQTASNVPPYNHFEGSSNPKRIVIETHPGGFSHWRFVPRARLAEGISDEGSWPRLVDVLGYVEFVGPRLRLLTCLSPQSPHHVRPGPMGYT